MIVTDEETLISSLSLFLDDDDDDDTDAFVSPSSELSDGERCRVVDVFGAKNMAPDVVDFVVWTLDVSLFLGVIVLVLVKGEMRGNASHTDGTDKNNVNQRKGIMVLLEMLSFAVNFSLAGNLRKIGEVE